MRALLLTAALVVVGCINSDFSNDAGVPRQMDFSIPVFDLSGLDLYSAYDCKALNACENACTTAVCVFNCRKMATPTAVVEEIALQDCFAQSCPTSNSSGNAICQANDMGTHSAACTTCINNTYVASNMSCSGSAPECHKCLVQASTCSNDP